MGEQVTAELLAREACEIEIDILKKPIGKQDQYIAAYGGLREIIFNPDESVIIKRIELQNSQVRHLGANILLYYTDITRKSSTILTHQKSNTSKNFDTMVRMRDQVVKFRDVLESESNMDQIGTLLNEGWELKKSLVDKISNNSIDNMYEQAINAGAIGGKIAGAGGGGFLLLYVNREKQNMVRSQMRNHREFPFMLDPYGSKIVFNMQRGYLK